MLSSVFMSNVSAEIIQVEADGRAFHADIEGLEGNLAQAKKRALADAMNNAAMKAGARVKGKLKSVDNILTENEVEIITVGHLHLNGEPKYRSESDTAFDDDEMVILIRCHAKFDVDTDEIERLLRSETSSETIQRNQNYTDNRTRIESEYDQKIRDYVMTEDESERRKIAEEIRKNNDKFTANEHLGRGNKLYDEKKYSEATGEYSKAIELDPNFKEAHNNRGLAYNDLGKYDEALQDYNKAVQLDPNYKDAYNNRGVAYGFLGKYDEAIQDLNKAIQLDPNFSLAYNNRGNTYLTFGKYDEAIRDYNKTIQLDTKYRNAYYNRGLAYFNLKKYDEAILDFNKSIQLDPNYKDAYNNRGVAYGSLGKYDEAVRDFNKAIELDPKYAYAYTNRGLAYCNLGKYDLALADFQKALELDPNNQNAEKAIELARKKLQQ